MTEPRYIDSHAHFFPLKYLKQLDELGINFGQTLDKQFTEVNPRINDMDHAGVAKQAVSIAVPGVNMSTPENSIQLARTVNDELSNLINMNERFIGLASLPMLDPEAAIEELDRAVNELGLKGVELFTDIGGKTLDDQSFWSVYERLSELHVPAFIHPIAPKHRDVYDEYSLLAVLGFPFETTHTATKIALSGLLEKYPRLKLVLSHLGGALPYLVGRIDDAFRMYIEKQTELSKPPSLYLKQMYLDGASFYPPAWNCALDHWSPDKIVMGSDYPYGWVGNYQNCVDVIKNLDIIESKKELILVGNSVKLLGLGGE